MSWVMREDFPRVRRGWDPYAVREHLRDVEEEIQAVSSVSRMSGRAAEGVRRVVQAAEETLAELTLEAQRELEHAAMEAEAIRAAARAGNGSPAPSVNGRSVNGSEVRSAHRESQRIVAAAHEDARRIVARAEAEAEARIDEARRAVDGLVGETMAMGRRVAALGEELARGCAPAQSPIPGDWDAVADPSSPPRRRFAPGAAGGQVPPVADDAGILAAAPPF